MEPRGVEGAGTAIFAVLLRKASNSKAFERAPCTVVSCACFTYVYLELLVSESIDEVVAC